MNCLLNVLTSQKSGLSQPVPRVPIWFMRQAGRYLPEYRKLRANFPRFMDFVHCPEASSEATLQPLKRFDLDAAIIFSDILVIPDALGQKVDFLPGYGPKLDPYLGKEQLSFDKFDQGILPTLRALSLTKHQLSLDKTLIGFSGAPWTLACYMLDHEKSKNYDAVRYYASAHIDEFSYLMAILCEAVSRYLIAQVDAGADVLKLFDSWSGLCPNWLITLGVLMPLQSVIKKVKDRHPNVPIIYFPRGGGEKLLALSAKIGADAVALDQFVDPEWVQSNIQEDLPLQGGLDPMVMKAGGSLLRNETDRYLTLFRSRPYVFNLGHGMVPDMPLDNVSRTIDHVRLFEQK